VVAAGATILIGLPMVNVAGHSLGVLKLANIVAFAINLTAVSIPGRIDGQYDEAMQRGELLEGSSSKTTPLASKEDDGDSDNKDTTYRDAYSTFRGRTLLASAPWAFAIWGPVYLGKRRFVPCRCGC
jgi:hypothetical protein